MIYAIIAAALFTRSLGTFVSIPEWQPTNNIPSAYHAYGTYNDGVGSAEYLRATATNAAAVNAIIDGAYERAWLGRDFGLAMVSNTVTGVTTNLYQQPANEWVNCVNGDFVGIRDDWESGEPRVITNSFRLLSWSNITATARTLARGNHKGWAADFGGSGLRNIRAGRVSPPYDGSWRASFPCETNGYPVITADAWIDVFPIFSMLEERFTYRNVTGYPRPHLAQWFGYAAAATGNVGAHWAMGNFGQIQTTPLGGAIEGYAQEGVYYAPQTVANVFADNLPYGDADALERHWYDVFETFTNDVIYVTNIYTTVTNISREIQYHTWYKVYYWMTNDTSRLYVTNISELPPPVEIAANVHHIITNQTPHIVAVTNVIYNAHDERFNLRNGTVTNNLTRRNYQTLTNEPYTMQILESSAVVTNSHPATFRLDWLKAGALNRFAGEMTSTYSVTNDLHLCRGRDENALAIYAWLRNSVDHDFSFTMDEYGQFAVDTNDFAEINWNILGAPEIQAGSTERSGESYHPTFRVAADQVKHAATAEMKEPMFLDKRILEFTAAEAIRGTPQYHGRKFEMRGWFDDQYFFPPRWYDEYTSIIYEDGVTNEINVGGVAHGLAGEHFFDKTNCFFEGTIAKSATATIFDRYDDSLLADDGHAFTNLAHIVPPRSIWNYVGSSMLYALDCVIAQDAYPILSVDPLSDPGDDVRAISPNNACSTGFRIPTNQMLGSFDDCRAAISNRYSALAASIATRTATDCGRSTTASAWTAANPQEIQRFQRNILPWQRYGCRFDFGVKSWLTKIVVYGHIEIDWLTTTNAVVDKIAICTDNYSPAEWPQEINQMYQIGWLVAECYVPEYVLQPLFEIRQTPGGGLTEWKRGTQYQIDAHEFPMFRTDWKWNCLTPTE